MITFPSEHGVKACVQQLHVTDSMCLLFPHCNKPCNTFVFQRDLFHGLFLRNRTPFTATERHLFPFLGSVLETPNPSLVNHILFLMNTFTCYYMFVCFESGVFLLCFPPESKEMNT